MLKLSTVMIGAEKSKELIAFYEKVFGEKSGWNDGEWAGWSVGDCYFVVGPHDKVKGTSKNPERIIINFDTKEVQKEFDRIKAAGATVIKEPYNPDEGNKNAWIATFADPEGNYFQLATPWEG